MDDVARSLTSVYHSLSASPSPASSTCQSQLSVPATRRATSSHRHLEVYNAFRTYPITQEKRQAGPLEKLPGSGDPPPRDSRKFSARSRNVLKRSFSTPSALASEEKSLLRPSGREEMDSVASIVPSGVLSGKHSLNARQRSVGELQDPADFHDNKQKGDDAESLLEERFSLKAFLMDSDEPKLARSTLIDSLPLRRTLSCPISTPTEFLSAQGLTVGRSLSQRKGTADQLTESRPSRMEMAVGLLLGSIQSCLKARVLRRAWLLKELAKRRKQIMQLTDHSSKQMDALLKEKDEREIRINQMLERIERADFEVEKASLEEGLESTVLMRTGDDKSPAHTHENGEHLKNFSRWEEEKKMAQQKIALAEMEVKKVRGKIERAKISRDRWEMETCMIGRRATALVRKCKTIREAIIQSKATESMYSDKTKLLSGRVEMLELRLARSRQASQEILQVEQEKYASTENQNLALMQWINTFKTRGSDGTPPCIFARGVSPTWPS